MNTTRNRIWIAFAIVLFVVILAGCEKVKTLPPFDKKILAEDCAVLIIPTNAKVKRIDGEKRGLFFSWGTGWLWKSKAATLLVPAGEHTMIFEYSHPQAGWSAKNLKYTAAMSAGKMYMVSATLDEKTKVGIFLSAINIATSFVRDDIIDIIPFVDWLPRSNPKGVVYQISEITDQTALDQYLLKESLPKGVYILGALIGFLWIFIIKLVSQISGHFLFMNRVPIYSLFMNRVLIPSPSMLLIVLIPAGIIIFNYNSSGFIFLYLIASLLICIGGSRSHLLRFYLGDGIKNNKNGVEKLNEADYAGALSNFNEAIKNNPYNAQYFHNRALAYFCLQDREKAITDLTKAVSLDSNNHQFKKGLTDLTESVWLDSNNAEFKKALAEATTRAADEKIRR